MWLARAHNVALKMPEGMNAHNVEQVMMPQNLNNPRSKLRMHRLVLKSTKHWFLLLDKFKEKLLKWIETKNWKPNVINFIKDYIDDLHATSHYARYDLG